MSLAKEVIIREDGPREGFQIHSEFIATERKLALINALSATGVKSIEVTSFVRPDRVPQHADANEVAKALPTNTDTRFRALYLNEKGLERAMKHPQLAVEGYILLAASENFLKKNNNISLSEAIAGVDSWLAIFKKHKLRFERLMLSTAFGESLTQKTTPKEVLNIVLQVVEKAGSDFELTLADTVGIANPEAVRELVGSIKEKLPSLAIGLHLHDTRGTGIANVYAGLLEGVDRFDCSVAGLGGCPFAKGAAGNVPTEDVAFLCAELGIKTGLDLDAYIDCAKLAEEIIGHKLPGKLKDVG